MTDHDAIHAIHAAAERGAPAYLSEVTQVLALLLRRSQLVPSQTARDEATGRSSPQLELPFPEGLNAAYGRSTHDYTPMPPPGMKGNYVPDCICPEGATTQCVVAWCPRRVDHSAHATSNPEECH